jgi:hypothetical protein
MKTEEEVRALKAKWQADPRFWDIEDTEGFEEHREELIAFRDWCREGWDKAARYREERSVKYNTDQAVAYLEHAGNTAGKWSSGEMLLKAQVHAILALVAEMKRGNDLREGA